MLISLHLPKTAGASFAAVLERHFKGSLLKDYADLPINTPPQQRNQAALQAALYNMENPSLEVECIHGHFLPVKYLLLNHRKELTFMTWMRQPVERMVSHYFFWRATYHADTSPALHRRMIEEEWSLERFCLGPELRDVYTQFLWAFPIEYFDFIGITEFYAEELAYFSSHYLKDSSGVWEERLNTGSQRTGDFYEIAPSLRKEMEIFHARDMAIYEYALNKRRARC